MPAKIAQKERHKNCLFRYCFKENDFLFTLCIYIAVFEILDIYPLNQFKTPISCGSLNYLIVLSESLTAPSRDCVFLFWIPISSTPL